MSTPSVSPGSVHLNYQNSVFYSPFRFVKYVFLGPWRTVMGVCTLGNLKFFPDVPITEQAPRIQGCFEKAAYLMGLNDAFPYIKEVHLPTKP
jgi:hypothetical protein